jgi:pimeloyl-ACP methyl ester carboxylesterase
MKKPAGAVEALRRAASPLARRVRGNHWARGPKLFMILTGYVARMTTAMKPTSAELLGLDERTAETSGMRYYAGGSGPPLVLVHGLAGSATNWVELVPELVERYRVLVVDLPGHGDSEPPRRGSNVSDFADAVAHVVELEDAGPAFVAGHSFGGHVALRLAHLRPDLVRGLLLVAPAGIATTTRSLQLAVALAGVVRPGRWVAPLRHRYAGRQWYRRALFRPWFVSDATAISERATVGFLEGQRLHLDTRTAGRAMIADDPRPDLEHVACPVLILWGARDAQLPLDDAFEYARRLRARLRIVADCGHLLIGERPAAVAAALDDLVALSN